MTSPLLILGAGAILFILVVGWGACRAAAESDRRLEERADRLAAVESMAAARERRERRNGIGRVGRSV